MAYAFSILAPDSNKFKGKAAAHCVTGVLTSTHQASGFNLNPFSFTFGTCFEQHNTSSNTTYASTSAHQAHHIYAPSRFDLTMFTPAQLQ